MTITQEREKKVRMRFAQEGWQKYEPLLRHTLGSNFETMNFVSVEEFFSARGQTRWFNAHMEGIASPSTDLHFFLRQVRELIEAFQLDEKLTLPEIFTQAAGVKPAAIH